AYSHSMLSTYENCPRQFKLRYIDRIKPPGGEEWIEAFLGSRVHEVLEKLYKDLILSKTNKLDDLLIYYNDQWEKNWHKGVVITKKGYTKKHYKDSGKRAIRDYYKRHYPFDRDRTLATEKLVYFDIKGYKIRGYIDRFSLAGDGTYEIHDYKTSGSLPPQSKFDSDRQLALYQIGISEQFPKAKNNTRLIWHYLLFDQTFESKRTASELRDLKKNVISLIKTIENDDDYRPSEGPLCDWCEYPQYCPARKHMFKVNSLPPNKYLKEKGVTIVNKYVSLKSRLDELKKEERSIQEELALLEEVAIKYADKREITSISGSDHILKISRDRIIQFPHPSDEGRDELERYLKKSGLWTVVAGLNTRKLASMVKRGEIDGRKLRAILKFAAEEERVTVKLVRKRGEE
ncbi:MAG: PD-(D/E)XK nuclease family protein, partial [Nitrospirae bacterium]